MVFGNGVKIYKPRLIMARVRYMIKGTIWKKNHRNPKFFHIFANPFSSWCTKVMLVHIGNNFSGACSRIKKISLLKTYIRMQFIYYLSWIKQKILFLEQRHLKKTLRIVDCQSIWHHLANFLHKSFPILLTLNLLHL